jgi:hypothetical protein
MPSVFHPDGNSTNNSTARSVSGESGFASNNARHSAFPFSNAVRAPYAAISSYSIWRMMPDVSGPGTALRNSRTDFGIVLEVNRGSAACPSFTMKSAILPGLIAYLKLAMTLIDCPLDFPIGIFEAAVKRAQLDGEFPAFRSCKILADRVKASLPLSLDVSLKTPRLSGAKSASSILIYV